MSDHRPFDRPWASRVPSSGSRPPRPSATDRPTGSAAQGSPPAGTGASPSRQASDSRASSAARGLADGLRAMAGDGDDGLTAEVVEEEAEAVEAPAGDVDATVVDAEIVGDETPSADATAGSPVDAAPDSTADAPDDDLAEAEAAISSDFQALARERDEYLEALRRLQADFENYKKRMMRQQTATLERAAEDLVSKLLPVLDTIDLARQHGGGEAIDQVATSLLDVLGKEGLERIAPAGKPFDPNEHEAVAHEPGDGDPEVVGLMRAGYRWKGRVLRPAMVTVKG